MVEVDPWTTCFLCFSQTMLFKRNASLQIIGRDDVNRHRPNWVCRKDRGATHKKGNSRNRSRSTKRSALYDAMSQYTEHFRPLLQAELDAEQASFRAQRQAKANSSMASRDKLVNVLARKRRRLFSNEVYQLTTGVMSGKRSNHDWAFTKGDLVDLSPDYDGTDDADSLQGVILSKSRNSIIVAFSLGSEASHQMNGYAKNSIPLRVERGTNTVSYNRALNALDRLVENGPGTPDIARLIVMSLISIVKWESISNIHFFEPGMTPIQNNGYTEGMWGSLATESVRRLEQQRLNEILKQLPTGVNYSQRAAIRKALRNRLTLIQGPPGTGKTFTVAYAIACALDLGLGPVLACAASNVATDNLSRKIIQTCGSKNRIVRVGHPSSIAEDLWEVSLDGIMERNPRVRDARNRFDRGVIQYSDLRNIQQQMSRQTLKSADVVLATCVGSGMDDLSELKFPMVIIDEATQATEMDVLIALCSSSALPLQVILVGDHHQLPPTILSSTTANNSGIGLETSMFLRLWMSGVPCELLNTQYRMHPSISRFPSIHFYNNKLKDGITEQDRRLPDRIKSQLESLVTGTRVILIDVPNGIEEKEPSIIDGDYGKSFLNQREANVVKDTVRLLCDNQNSHSLKGFTSGFKSGEIGVISPYAGQVKTIQTFLADDLLLRHVEVKTVDGFQGREKDTVIISTVRSNVNGDVGFLKDWRRLNVAITRARQLVIVVCNSRTLMRDKHWSSWIHWVRRNGAFVQETSIASKDLT